MILCRAVKCWSVRAYLQRSSVMFWTRRRRPFLAQGLAVAVRGVGIEDWASPKISHLTGQWVEWSCRASCRIQVPCTLRAGLPQMSWWQSFELRWNKESARWSQVSTTGGTAAVQFCLKVLCGFETFSQLLQVGGLETRKGPPLRDHFSAIELVVLRWVESKLEVRKLTSLDLGAGKGGVKYQAGAICACC